MKKFLVINFVLVSLFFIAPNFASANIGVSNNTAKIVLDKAVIPGASYDIPSFQVKNTGTDASDFGISTEFNQIQDENRPNPSWIIFTPSNFHLEPGESKIVKVRLDLPTSAESGDYFSYIEAHSMKNNSTGGTSIAGAASTKFYFSVAKTSIFVKAYYAAISFVHKNSSWSYIVLALLSIGILYLIVKRVNAIISHIKSQKLN